MIWSPSLSTCKSQNTALSVVESRWPAMTALPGSPGRKPLLNQATSLHSLGTSIAPSAASPTLSTGAFTRMAGIVSCVGTGPRAADVCAAACEGDGTLDGGAL